MKRVILAIVVALALQAAPSEAFSLKTPIKKTGHALKVVGEKVGAVGLYIAAGVAVIAFCSSGGCR